MAPPIAAFRLSVYQSYTFRAGFPRTPTEISSPKKEPDGKIGEYGPDMKKPSPGQGNRILHYKGTDKMPPCSPFRLQVLPSVGTGQTRGRRRTGTGVIVPACAFRSEALRAPNAAAPHRRGTPQIRPAQGRAPSPGRTIRTPEAEKHPKSLFFSIISLLLLQAIRQDAFRMRAYGFAYFFFYFFFYGKRTSGIAWN